MEFDHITAAAANSQLVTNVSQSCFPHIRLSVSLEVPCNKFWCVWKWQPCFVQRLWPWDPPGNWSFRNRLCVPSNGYKGILDYSSIQRLTLHDNCTSIMSTSSYWTFAESRWVAIVSDSRNNNRHRVSILTHLESTFFFAKCRQQ